jgi:hypothetical protein
MKIRSELRAGRTFDDCARERDWWKKQAGLMEEFANSKKYTPPAELWFPPSAVQLPSTPPTYPSTGANHVYPDMSGVCG